MAMPGSGGEVTCGVRGGEGRGGGPRGGAGGVVRDGVRGAWCPARGGVRRIARGVRAGDATGAPSRRVILPV